MPVGPKARLTSARSCVWRGGSRVTRDWATGLGPSQGGSAVTASASEEKRWASLKMARTSS